MMCNAEKFCSKIGTPEKQLILITYNGASDIVPITPDNNEMQDIYKKLVDQKLLELRKVGTRTSIDLWPLKSNVIIPRRGEVHALLTEEGSKKTIGLTPCTDIDNDNLEIDEE
jgi:hypothetical protein